MQKFIVILGVREIDYDLAPDAKVADLLKHRIARRVLSACAYHRVMKVARTIAAPSAVSTAVDVHTAEAIQYRRFVRG